MANLLKRRRAHTSGKILVAQASRLCWFFLRESHAEQAVKLSKGGGERQALAGTGGKPASMRHFSP